MERLLAILFSISLLQSTAPPRAVNENCDFMAGICVLISSSGVTDCSGQGEENDCEKNKDCALPVCCSNGPCCCLCLVPERPVIHAAPVSAETNSGLPSNIQHFCPQQVLRSIWKPPAMTA
ncbi:MAG: hypothetical protein SFV22_02235 [Saprospiraceae bacterium]|nr:hypothetical protein [Saprospiraceae bacterium]